MRSITFLCCVFLGLNVFANDTLTRAQVYNFSVGDTFDYFHLTYTHDRPYGTGQILDSSYSYSRYIVTNIYFSIDSSTKFIERKEIYPPGNVYDTLVLQSLTGYEVYLDTLSCFYAAITEIAFLPNSAYNGRTINILSQLTCQPGSEKFTFCDGLGPVIVKKLLGGCGPCSLTYDSTTLIYYNQGGETWGTPYTDFPTAIQEISASNNKMTLFPTVNDGTVNVKLSDTDLLPMDFVICDMAGKKVKQLTLTNLNNEVSLGDASTGIYIWTAISKNQIIQKGKVVIH